MKSHYDKSHHLKAWHHSKRQWVQRKEMKRTKSLGCRLCGAMDVEPLLLLLQNSICNFPQTDAKPGILELEARRKGSNSKKIWKWRNIRLGNFFESIKRGHWKKIPFFSTLKSRYNEPRYSEFRNIVNQTQLPFLGFTKHITFDIVNYSI